MSWLSRLAPGARYALGGAILIIAIVFGVFLWVVLGPGPTAFAGGNTVALADYRGPDPTGAPSELARGSLVQRGEYLARAADCEACHTARGGAPFAGGLGFVLPFGTIYSANITADKDTGIGSWSDAAFLNALHSGRDDQGVPLYPAMPYASYSTMTDGDALAIKAYLFSLPPVHNEVPDNALQFPFNQRWLMGIWSTFFNKDQRFRPNTERSAQWNRGAYLSEALAHCGECHTPRNLAFALDNRRKFAGALTAGWRAYDITSDAGTGVGAWHDDDLFNYLANGHATGHGTASGPMAEAVDKSFSQLAPEDVRAIVTYLRSIPAVASADLPATLAPPAPASPRGGPLTTEALGKHVFEGACAGCHGWTGQSPISPFATLTGARAVNDPSADNVAQIVISGTRRTTAGVIPMPAFGWSMSDAEIAAVANYVTARFGSSPSHITAQNVAQLRQQTAQ